MTFRRPSPSTPPTVEAACSTGCPRATAHRADRFAHPTAASWSGGGSGRVAPGGNSWLGADIYSLPPEIQPRSQTAALSGSCTNRARSRPKRPIHFVRGQPVAAQSILSGRAIAYPDLMRHGLQPVNRHARRLSLAVRRSPEPRYPRVWLAGSLCARVFAHVIRACHLFRLESGWPSHIWNLAAVPIC